MSTAEKVFKVRARRLERQVANIEFHKIYVSLLPVLVGIKRSFEIRIVIKGKRSARMNSFSDAQKQLLQTINQPALELPYAFEQNLVVSGRITVDAREKD